jgi:hypothetical protein
MGNCAQRALIHGLLGVVSKSLQERIAIHAKPAPMMQSSPVVARCTAIKPRATSASRTGSHRIAQKTSKKLALGVIRVVFVRWRRTWLGGALPLSTTLTGRQLRPTLTPISTFHLHPSQLKGNLCHQQRDLFVSLRTSSTSPKAVSRLLIELVATTMGATQL